MTVSTPTEIGDASTRTPFPPAAGDVARRAARLNILIVSHAFPPANLVGAVRIGKFARFLHKAGHDVRVVAAPAAGDASLPLEIPAERVVYPAGWAGHKVSENLVGLVRRFGPRKGSGGAVAASAAPPAAPGDAGFAAAVTHHCRALLHIRDARVGWIGAASVAGYDIARGWRPDIVVGSGPPHSGLVAAARIARICGAPWVADLRDLWAVDACYTAPLWRLWLDRVIERRVLGSAAGLVTVSPAWAATLRGKYRQPVACILNGYDDEDLSPERSAPPPGDVVSIVYTGDICIGDRDPSPLFEAIGLLGDARAGVTVHFYGPAEAAVIPLARRHGAADRIVVHNGVPQKSSLALQSAADVLLLLQRNHPRDEGNIPAEFFEYLGAGRPILMLGYEKGDLAALIRKRRAGVVANDPAAIARQLRSWIAQRPAGIPPVDPAARAGLGRAQQFQEYERFLNEILLAEQP
ncbi:MAG TPA: glycosyltransferase [Stellaceae bacterium]